MTDRVYCSDFVISKIVVGIVVGGGFLLFVDGGDLTSFPVLVDRLELDSETHGLVKFFVGFHHTTSDRFVEAREKQLMLKELFSIPDTFSLTFSEVSRRDGDGQRGDVGGDSSEGGDVGRLGLAHLGERVVHPQVVVVNSLTLTLGKLREVRTGNLGSIPGLVTREELVFDGIPIVPVDAGIL